MNFRTQLEAIGSALLLIQKLPDTTVWSLTCTNDDDAESPSVLNIFADESEWTKLATLLKLGKPTDRSANDLGEQFVSYRQGTLYISIIQPEEQ